MGKKGSRKPLGFDTSKRRKRWAPKGNVSAVKHGFYGKRFSDEELMDIGRLAVANLSLDEEIAMLRVLMRRLLEAEGLGVQEVMELFGRATGQLGRLVERKIRLESAGKSSRDVESAYERALDELSEELGVEL